MSKEELYDALRADGARLKPANFYSKEALADIYTERFGAAPGEQQTPPDLSEEANTAKLYVPGERYPEPTGQKNSANELDDTPEEIRLLHFAFGGWCEELNCSFSAGYKRCSTIEEYRALKKYATKVL